MKYKQILSKLNPFTRNKKANKNKILINKPEIIEQNINRNKFGYPFYTDKNNRNLKQ